MLLRILLACLVLGRHLCPVLAARLCGEESRHECQRGQPSQGCYGCVFRQGSHLPSTLREVPAQHRPPAVELPGDLQGAGGAGRGLEGACATWAQGGSVLLASRASGKSSRGLSPPPLQTSMASTTPAGGWKPVPLGWRAMPGAERAVPERSAFDLACRKLAPLQIIATRHKSCSRWHAGSLC